MDALRNGSSQPLNLYIGGKKIHLFPGRAVTLSSEDLNSPQVRSFLQRGLATLEKIGAAPRGAVPKPAEEKNAEKKRPNQ